MTKLGLSHDEATQLRRIEMTLSRWSELECGNSNQYTSWAIERDEETGRPFMVTHGYDYGTGSPITRTPIADREAGALKRLKAIMARHPKLWYFHQSDPRGCALYVGRKGDLPKNAFQVVRTGSPVKGAGWTIKPSHGEAPYCGGSYKRAAIAFAKRETLSSYYTRGVAVCI